MKVLIICSLALATLAEPPVNRYLPPQQGYNGGPSGPSQTYGLPGGSSGFGGQRQTDAIFGQRPSSTYGAPTNARQSQPSSQYGSPRNQVSNQYLPPRNQVSNQYLPPRNQVSNQYLPPRNQVSKQYLPPQNSAASQYNAPSSQYSAPSSQYGAPTQNNAPSSQYSAPSSQYSAPSSQYGAPSQNNAPSSQYSAPSSQYGAPSQNNARSSQYSAPSSQYLPASRNSYQAPIAPSSQYGAPGKFAQPSNQYGTPSFGRNGAQPSQQYGAPEFGGRQGSQDIDRSYLPPGSNGYSGDEGNNEPANYSFEYMVKDEPSGNNFGHRESRQGDRAEGLYYVLLPDGRKQTVEYEADENGYKPRISYEDTGLAGGYGRGQNGYEDTENQGPY